MKTALLLALVFSQSVFAVDTPANDLNLVQVQKISQKALEYGRKKGWKLSVAVVNAEGTLLHFQRDDGAFAGSVDAAVGKAKASSLYQRPTAAFVDGLKQGRTGLVTVPNVVAIEGGVPIVLGGKNVGAIGVSGAKSLEDEEAAKAALE